MKRGKKAICFIVAMSTLYSAGVTAYADDTETNKIGIATLKGEIGSYDYWGENDSSNYGTVINASADLFGDAQYTVSWQFPDNDEALKIHYLRIDLESTDETSITKIYYPNMEITVQSVVMDGVSVSYQTGENSIDMECTANDTVTTRIYFVDQWNGNYQDIPSDVTVTNEIAITFTIQNLERATDAGTDHQVQTDSTDQSGNASTSGTTTSSSNAADNDNSASSGAGESQDTDTSILYGDVDNDKEHTIRDAYLTLKEYASISAEFSASFFGATKTRADVDGDGEITLQNAYLILQYYVKKSAGFDVTPETFFPAAKQSTS